MSNKVFSHTSKPKKLQSQRDKVEMGGGGTIVLSPVHLLRLLTDQSHTLLKIP
jgi:hypothetical protein